MALPLLVDREEVCPSPSWALIGGAPLGQSTLGGLPPGKGPDLGDNPGSWSDLPVHGAEPQLQQCPLVLCCLGQVQDWSGAEDQEAGVGGDAWDAECSPWATH